MEGNPVVFARLMSVALLSSALVMSASCNVVSGLDAFEVDAASGGSTGGGNGGASTGSSGEGGAGGGPLPEPCGNGALDAGEECDDGNTAAGDGCSQQCHLEEDPDGCGNGGAHIQLTTAGIWIRDNTSNRGAGESTACGGNSASELLFEIELMEAGLVTAALEANFTGMVAMADWCWPNDAANCDSSDIEASVNGNYGASEIVYVFVGGQSGQEGAFILHLTLQP